MHRIEDGNIVTIAIASFRQPNETVVSGPAKWSNENCLVVPISLGAIFLYLEDVLEVKKIDTGKFLVAVNGPFLRMSPALKAEA